jgi:acyl-CoA thioester hydrolase
MLRSMLEPHELQLRVRYAETDQMGVVHHASYLVYMEEGRTALMRSLGFPYEEVERRGFAMAVRRVEVRYRVAARYGDQVLVRTSIERFRQASILYVYEIVRAGDLELLASGSAEVACLERRDGELRPAPLPEDIRKALEQVLGA